MQNATDYVRTTPRFATVLLFLLAACHSEIARSEDGSTAAVVFVCEHGSVKSLVAAVLFNKRAAERGSSIRAVARGMRPDAAVPRRIADALQDDDFDVADFRPQALSSHDIEQAAMLVTIGVDPARIDPQPSVPLSQWNDVPGSASYTLMRQSLLRHVDEILAAAEISRRRRTP
jgi:protein-tyrosine-phosphatase